MGNQSGRSRQYILYLITFGGLITILTAVSCVPATSKVEGKSDQSQPSQPAQPRLLNVVPCVPAVSKDEGKSDQERLVYYQDYLADGSYENVIQQCLLIVNKNDAVPPADVALYTLGEVYAHHAYPGRNYALSKDYFGRLITNFPNSPLSSEARTFVALYEAFAEKDKKISILEKEQKTKMPTREALTERNFEAAVKENLRVIKASGQKPPADQALYNLGLIYAHIDNPAKDFQKAQRYFAELIKKFPASPLTVESHVWLGLFEVFEKMQQIDLDIEQQKNQLNR